jgi:type III secretion system chaperone SycN
MGVFENAVADFGRRLGIPDLSPGGGADRGAVVDLHFESFGRLQLEAVERHVLVTLARPLPRHDDACPARLLAACHWRRNHAHDLHPGMAGEAGDRQMTLTARVPLEEFTAIMIEELLARLGALLDGVEKEHG